MSSMPPKKLMIKRPELHIAPKSSPGSAKKPATKASAAVLAKRREGRHRAMERLQSKLDELGVRRTDDINNMDFSSIPSVQLINQKNYFTDYLKRDDQFRMIRQMKERVIEARLARKRKQNGNGRSGADIVNKLKHSTSVASSMSSLNSSGTEEDEDDEIELDLDKVLVFEPGSENIRIGRCLDVNPIIVKNVVAYKKSVERETGAPDPPREVVDGDIKIEDEQFTNSRQQISASFRERMRYYKRRIMPNSHESCANYNKRVQHDIIPDMNDIHRVEWVGESSEVDHVIGEDVFRLAEPEKWLIRSPFLGTGFNDGDVSYESGTEILGDVELLLYETLKKQYGIQSKGDLAQYSLIFIIPNMYSKAYVETMVDFLLNRMGFKQIALIEAGLASTFGCGISTGCVVDVGATSTRVCCVEEGMIIPHSQVILNYGSSDVTRVFVKNLLDAQFPYGEIDLDNLADWQLATELKQDHCTFNDANVAVQGFSFVSRKPHRETRKYQFKCFDEVMVSPMGLFYPQVFVDEADPSAKALLVGKLSPSRSIRQHGLLANRSGVFEGHENIPPSSLLQSVQESKISINEKELKDMMHFLLQMDSEDETFGGLMKNEPAEFSLDRKTTISSASLRKNMAPLDEAIVESITMAGYDSAERLEALYSNISLAGGGVKIESFDDILVDRLNITRSPVFGSNKLAEIVALVKDWRKESKDAAGFKLNKTQIQRITNMVNNSQLLPIEILPNAEVDPALMSWKGGSVFSRLKIIEELWLSAEDWDRLGSRSLNYISLFNY